MRGYLIWLPAKFSALATLGHVLTLLFYMYICFVMTFEYTVSSKLVCIFRCNMLLHGKALKAKQTALTRHIIKDSAPKLSQELLYFKKKSLTKFVRYLFTFFFSFLRESPRLYLQKMIVTNLQLIINY